MRRNKKTVEQSSTVNSLGSLANYLTLSHFAESQAAESPQQESTAALSTTATESESTGAACSVLLPHDANEIAATATNINTNFFISLLF